MGLKVREGTLHAVEERRLEIDPFAQIAQKVHDGRAAGLVEHPADGERAGGVRELRLRGVEPRKP